MSIIIQSLEDAKLQELRQKHMDAMGSNDPELYLKTLDDLMDYRGQMLQKEYMERQSEIDDQIRASRGDRVLTSREKAYYTRLAERMKAKDPKEVMTDIDLTMPDSIFTRVFDGLRTNHPLLSKIRFYNTNGIIRFLLNMNPYQRAAWSELCADIIQEIRSGFRIIDSTLLKLSAFVPMCKAMLDLGPEWLDRYIVDILYEALANGLEWGVINGSGKEEPIGMIRQVGDDVSVTGGEYPEKIPISITNFSMGTMGNLASILAANPNGQARDVNDLILVVNPQDYFQKVGPATMMLTPQGTYVNTLPYDVQIIKSAALPRGRAVFGIASMYLGFVGMARDGRIEYSDEYRFLEDERVYLIKTYANGMPADNNAFLVLDISGLQPASYKVTVDTPGAPSAEARLSSLKIGSLKLSPGFEPDETTYTTSTGNNTNTITAIPANAAASIKVEVNDVEINNGTAAVWQSGGNTVKITVTAEDGTSDKEYTVTVTKSGV